LSGTADYNNDIYKYNIDDRCRSLPGLLLKTQF